LNPRLVADRRMRKRPARPRLGRIFATIAMHMVETFGLGIVRFEVCV
jgi:hypothetical protein